jgi:hypothetical protein
MTKEAVVEERLLYEFAEALGAEGGGGVDECAFVNAGKSLGLC